jgi:hypothetical protein
MKASLKGHTSTVKLLLEYGAATEAKGDDVSCTFAFHEGVDCFIAQHCAQILRSVSSRCHLSDFITVR